MKLAVIIISILVIVALILIETIIYPSFLQKYIYHLGMVVASILLTMIAYLNYDMKQSTIHTKLIVFHKSDDIAKQQFPQLSSETGFFLLVIVNNTGKVIVNPMHISNNQKQTLHLFTHQMKQEKMGFGYILKEGERYSNVQAINKHSLEIFKNSSVLYVEDIRKRKYFISKKDLKEGKKHIQKIESKLFVS